MDWLQVVIKEVVKNWMAIIIYFALGVVLIGIGWLPQKIGRNNDRQKADERLQLQLQQQRKDLRADFREELKSIIPVLLEIRLKGRQPKQAITHELEEQFVGIAETLSTAWFNGKDIKAIFVDPDFRLEDFQEHHGDDKDDKAPGIKIFDE